MVGITQVTQVRANSFLYDFDFFMASIGQTCIICSRFIRPGADFGLSKRRIPASQNLLTLFFGFSEVIE